MIIEPVDTKVISCICYLQMADEKLVENVIPSGTLEDRQVTEIMLQPSGLGLEMKRKKHFRICLQELQELYTR